MTDNDERFAVLTEVARVWAVGAIHADVDRLKAVHAELENRFELGDRLVYLGNYLGDGGDVIATLDELTAFRRRLLVPGMEPADIVYLRGSQEEMWHKLLQIQFAPGPGEVLSWMINQGIGATLAAYGGDPEAGHMKFREGVVAATRWTGELRSAMQGHPGHADVLNGLKRAAYTEGGELLFVHAGIDPDRPLTEQGDTFWWGSGYFADMAQPFASFRRVVRGFDRQKHGAGITEYTASLDGGCGFGGTLIAACFTLDGDICDRIEA
ncbi:MAG: hypothetical protein O3A21_05690 [Proteobacteria bacterium]|nr:hypothetical protein [Pseudomonadota bacterium]